MERFEMPEHTITRTIVDIWRTERNNRVMRTDEGTTEHAY
jgi:hypothetical protein